MSGDNSETECVSYEKMEDLIHYSEKTSDDLLKTVTTTLVNRNATNCLSRLFIRLISSFSFDCETSPNRIDGLPASGVDDR